jgi:hypothetical protein
MANTELSRRVGRVVGYPPLSEMSDLQRRAFHEALLDAADFEDLAGKWQAAILKAEQNGARGHGLEHRGAGRHCRDTDTSAITFGWLHARRAVHRRGPMAVGARDAG